MDIVSVSLGMGLSDKIHKWKNMNYFNNWEVVKTTER